jgi:hypothetical protein
MPHSCKTADEAARVFVVVFQDAPDPRPAFESFLRKIEASPNWNPAEIDAVRRLIVERMPQLTTQCSCD